jgi:hypothetical protein
LVLESKTHITSLIVSNSVLHLEFAENAQVYSAERISAKEAMDHPYFDSLDKSQFWSLFIPEGRWHLLWSFFALMSLGCLYSTACLVKSAAIILVIWISCGLFCCLQLWLYNYITTYVGFLWQIYYLSYYYSWANQMRQFPKGPCRYEQFIFWQKKLRIPILNKIYIIILSLFEFWLGRIHFIFFECIGVLTLKIKENKNISLSYNLNFNFIDGRIVDRSSWIKVLVCSATTRCLNKKPYCHTINYLLSDNSDNCLTIMTIKW